MHRNEESERHRERQSNLPSLPLKEQERRENYLHRDKREIERGRKSRDTGNVKYENPFQCWFEREEHGTCHVACVAVHVVATDAPHSQAEERDEQQHRGDVQKSKF